MRLLGLDFETTGFDTQNDRITEIGLALWCTERKAPLMTKQIFLYDEGIQARCNPETIAMMERVSGISPAMLQEFGILPKGALEQVDKFSTMHGVDYVVAHNGENYDKPILMAELDRHDATTICLHSLPWLDTRTDIPFSAEPDSRKLKHLALDAGFINPFSHRALFDTLTMLRVLSAYDIEEVISYSKIPFVTIRAVVEYENRQLAKDRRFAWERVGDKVYPKKWVKRVKIDQLEKEMKDCPFKIIQLEEK